MWTKVHHCIVVVQKLNGGSVVGAGGQRRSVVYRI
jgi:hypothetical protein